jgi:hypothetical protein
MTHRCCSKLLLILALVFNPGAFFAQRPAVQVEVYDYADMTPGAVHKVLALTQEILTGAGVSIRVIFCRPNPEAACGSQSVGTRLLVIRVAPGGPKKGDSVLRPPLGLSIVGPEGGTYASIFLARVRDAAAEANVPRDLVLAYAIGHEVGHLLLGADAHSAQGLMKATWGREDYEAMYQCRFHFNHDQSRQLSTRYGSSPETNIRLDR